MPRIRAVANRQHAGTLQRAGLRLNTRSSWVAKTKNGGLITSSNQKWGLCAASATLMWFELCLVDAWKEAKKSLRTKVRLRLPLPARVDTRPANGFVMFSGSSEMAGMIRIKNYKDA